MSVSVNSGSVAGFAAIRLAQGTITRKMTIPLPPCPTCLAISLTCLAPLTVGASGKRAVQPVERVQPLTSTSVSSSIRKSKRLVNPGRVASRLMETGLLEKSPLSIMEAAMPLWKVVFAGIQQFRRLAARSEQDVRLPGLPEGITRT